MTSSSISARRTAATLVRHLPERPRLAIVLGSGFTGVARRFTVLAESGYEALAGFPRPRVGGHTGKMVLARLHDVPVLMLCGRSHYYEGHSMAEITFPIRVLAECGIDTLLLTNAAGGINRQFRPGDFMCLTDHINFMGANPLRREKASNPPSFVDLSGVYDPGLGHLMKLAGRRAKARVRTGVYLAVSGPAYETPAEIRAFARLGADAVGMSTVPEAIVARELGLKVAALSCITNRAAGRGGNPISHAEVLALGEASQAKFACLLARFVELFSRWQSA